MNSMNRIPVLNYHGILSSRHGTVWSEAESVYALPDHVFTAQLELLREKGYESLTLNKLGDLLSKEEISGQQVLLTFDDGLISHFLDAYPELQKRNFSGLFFVSAGLVGQEGMMTWEHLKELIRNGHEIGSHGMTHIPLTYLSAAKLEEEIIGSKKLIEDKLGVPVKSFSVPRGFYRKNLSRMAADAGYEFVFTSIFDANHPGQNKTELHRLAVKSSMSEADFLALVSCRIERYRKNEKLKEIARSILPPAFYDQLALIKKRLGLKVGA